MLRTTTLALALVLAACDGADPAGLAIPPGAYHLATVDGRALPVTVERTGIPCDANPSRTYFSMVEARRGTLTVATDGTAQFAVDRWVMCENDRVAPQATPIEAIGRVSPDGLVLDGYSPFPIVMSGDGSVTATVSGLDLGIAGRRLRFVPAAPVPDPTGVWEGHAVYELDTTYATRTSPDEPRRHRLYRRFDLTFDLTTRSDSVVGTGRYVSYFERMTTNLTTGEVYVTGGRNEQQEDRTFSVRGTLDGPVLLLDWYGGGVLLNWMDHPLVLEGDVLRTGLRNFFEGSYYSTPSVDLALVRR